jgi:cation diffusion facilitator CzcD-associated flavoprotein CzcO
VHEYQVAVIGAGPAGIAVALSLRDRGIRPLLIDRADAVASSWRTRYDVLRLNTGRPFSHLPKRRYPSGTPMFPSRDNVVAHLDRHAHEDGVDLRLGTEVTHIDRAPGGWRLRTSTGDIHAPQVVVATGNHCVPVIPSIPGADTFPGEQLHSSAYRNPAPYARKRVLVVGSGSSGMEIVYDLATGGAAEAWLAVRTPPNIMLRSLPNGMPAEPIAVALYHAPVRLSDAMSRRARRASLGDLSAYGLPVPEEGPFSRMRRMRKVPTIVDMEIVDAVRNGSFEVVPIVVRFDGASAHLADGRVLQPDAVIYATGYRTGLEPLVGHLGLVDDRGVPVASGVPQAAKGLRFVGYTARPGFIGFVARQSRRVAKKIASELTSG